MVNDPSRETGSRTKPAWKALEEHYRSIRNVHLRQLFSDDPKRGERFVVERQLDEHVDPALSPIQETARQKVTR
jgi:hypothetical protein